MVAILIEQIQQSISQDLESIPEGGMDAVYPMLDLKRGSSL